MRPHPPSRRLARAGTILIAAGALAACGLGQSRLNPLNWFGAARSTPVAAEVAAAGPRIPVVDRVVSLDVAPTPGGAIVSAVGLPPTQGFWEAELVRRPGAEAGTMLFEFRILPPVRPKPVGTQPSREVLAGTRVTTQDLSGIRVVAVQGATNRLSVSRR